MIVKSLIARTKISETAIIIKQTLGIKLKKEFIRNRLEIRNTLLTAIRLVKMASLYLLENIC